MWVYVPLIPGLNRLHTAHAFAQYLHVMLAHLGYPEYFKYILGSWQLACAITLIWPRLARAKEWAYIGAFINYSSACVSHAFVGDGLDAAALVMGVLTFVSWALRPVRAKGEISWASAAALLATLVFLAFFYVPR